MVGGGELEVGGDLLGSPAWPRLCGKADGEPSSMQSCPRQASERGMKAPHGV